MLPDVQQDLPPSPCPVHSDRPGPCLERKHLRRGRIFLFSPAQPSSGQGRRGMRAMACMDELPTKRGVGAPGQASLDGHILQNNPFTQIGDALVRRRRKNENTQTKPKPTKTHTQTNRQNFNPSCKAATGPLYRIERFPSVSLLVLRKTNSLASSCQMPHNHHPNNAGGKEGLLKLICASVIVTTPLKRTTHDFLVL